jgi:N-acetylglutamate synthase-like GNAT family acetyltransferase
MEMLEFIIETEKVIRKCESHFPPNSSAAKEWLMWLGKESFPPVEANPLKLQKVEDERGWQEMIQLRIDIEKEFGIHDEELINGFVADIRQKVKLLNGSWFLASSNDEIIGEVGLVPFKFAGKSIGRLQDVDIHPARQGLGFGRHLLLAICNEARVLNLDGLCLFARADKWVKNWYQRFGFIKIGSVSREGQSI